MKVPLRRVLFWTVLAAIAGVHVFSLVHGLIFSRLWGDEGYNLTVAINLAAGHGYASDGILTSGRFDAFDPRVSTGPTVLIPIAGFIVLGIEPVVAGRLVMSLIFIGSVAAIGLLGWRIGRGSGLVVAVTVPLVFDATNPDSPMQSPVDVIGEWPAAGLLALALVVVSRRPWLAGLLIGLAVQAKLVAIISLPVIALMLLLTVAPLRERIRAVLLVGVMAVVPTLVFELAKLIQLGPAGYLHWLAGFLDFLVLKKIPFLPLEKVRAILDSWFIPSTWLVAAVLLIAIVATSLALKRIGPRAVLNAVRQGSRYWLVAVCLLLAVVWAIWWVQSRADLIWIRHLFPGFVPAVAGVLAWAWHAWMRLTRSSVTIERVAGVVAIACTAVALSIGVGGRLWYVTHPPIPETLAEQREVAEAVREYGGDELVGPWGAIPIAILAGMHPVPFDLPHDERSPTLLVRGEEGWDDPDLCPTEAWAVGNYRLCVGTSVE